MLEPMAEPSSHTLRLYTQPSDHDRLDWGWVDDQLRAAGTYWVVLATSPEQPRRPPHPRPVWGVWEDQRLALSIGSPVVRRLVENDAPATIHLDSGTDVVIVEGVVAGPTDHTDTVAAYEAKYDWSYDVAEYGPLTVVVPTTVLAWRTAGWAGRDSFQQTGRWTFPPLTGV
jgi:hypothetical protein